MGNPLIKYLAPVSEIINFEINYKKKKRFSRSFQTIKNIEKYTMFFAFISIQSTIIVSRYIMSESLLIYLFFILRFDDYGETWAIC